MKIERKTFNLAEFKIDAGAGSFEGYASIFGNVDDGGDVVMPGAFTKAIPDFLRDGFLSWSHDWTMPVAMPTMAREDTQGLYIAGEFHSTAAAQDARTIAAERVAKGLRMGLSIGYGIEDSAMAGNTRQLKTLYPLYETGLVLVPMNREANMTTVKGLADTASLPASVGRILDDLPGIVTRLSGMADQRVKDGRVLSASNRALIRELLDTISAASGPLGDLLDATEPDKGKAVLQIAALLEEARFLGVPV